MRWVATALLLSTPCWAAPPAPPGPPRPFGPGAPLEVRSEDEVVTIFVARLDGLGPYDAPRFQRVGRTPLTLELPVGTFAVEAEGYDVSNGSTTIEMRGAPKRIVVSPGSSGQGALGGIFLGIGILAVAGATVVLASGSKGTDDFDKPAVVIPAYIVGAAAVGAGIGFMVAGNTTLTEQKPSAGTGFVAGFGGRF